MVKQEFWFRRVDLISWRILLEDFETAYRQIRAGQGIQLPTTTTPYTEWAARLTSATSAGALHAEVEYWASPAGASVAPLPRDRAAQGNGTMNSAAVASAKLDPKETRILLEEIPAIYGVRINDVLLTALVRALSAWTGYNDFLIDIEGLGREPVFEGVDLWRTIGWFTPVYPVLLQAGGREIADTLKSVQRQLAGVPNHGVGYSALRYLSKSPEISARMRAIPTAEIAFLYQGRSALSFNDSSIVAALAKESSGTAHSSNTQLSHLLSINTAIVAGELCSDWIYSTQNYKRETIQTLAQSHLHALRSLVQTSRSEKQAIVPVSV